MSDVKKVFISFILIILIVNPVYAVEDIINSQLDNLNLSDFIKEGEEYTNDVFEDLDVKELISSAVRGNIDNNIYKNIFTLFGKEVLSSIKMLASILIIIVIHSILKSIGENLGNNNIGKVAYYVEYILIVSLILANFSQIVTYIKESISHVVGFLNTLVPLLVTLVMSTGATMSAGVIQPILLFSIIFIGNVINNFIIPVAIIATILGIISNLSEKIQINKLSKFLKTSTLWLLGIITTVFVSALSLEGTLTSSLDGVTLKGIQTATSTLIPVVGKALGDSVSTVLGCTTVIKNAIGVIGIIIIIGICALPIIKLTVLTLLYSFSTALAEPLADKGIVKVLEQMSDTFKLLLGIMIFVATLFIIGIAITLRISNTSLMFG